MGFRRSRVQGSGGLGFRVWGFRGWDSLFRGFRV